VRLLLVIGLACVVIPVRADARPKRKVAVAPIAGDPKNQLGLAIVAALGAKDFVVIGPRVVSRELTRLGLSEQLSPEEARTLTVKLGVIATIDGSVTRAGRKRSLHLDVHPRGKPVSGFTIEYRSTTSDGFRRGVHDEIVKKLDRADEPDPGDEPTAPRSRPDDEPHAAVAAPSPERDRAEAPRLTQVSEISEISDVPDARAGRDPAPTASDAPSELHHDEPDRPEPRAPVTLARVGAGASFAHRQLTFDTRDNFAQRPPRLLTTAGAGRIDGEIYPFALAGSGRALARLGIAGAYDKTFGLSVPLPGEVLSAPIHQQHYSIGARYRLLIGEAATLTFGLDYERRQSIADRSGLMAMVLDTPDVDYTAIAPGAAVHVPITGGIAVFGSVNGMIVLGSGPIQDADSYGPGTVYGVEAAAGITIALARRFALRIAFELSQIQVGFDATGAMATNRDNDPTTRDVNGAADRSVGGVATLDLTY
jgi:hypothetical protein